MYPGIPSWYHGGYGGVPSYMHPGGYGGYTLPCIYTTLGTLGTPDHPTAG